LSRLVCERCHHEVRLRQQDVPDERRRQLRPLRHVRVFECMWNDVQRRQRLHS
jgi:hypothetical protein